ncbi:MAG TPA: hypothetical protein VGN09_10125 [Vicinamibacteria bacterium]
MTINGRRCSALLALGSFLSVAPAAAQVRADKVACFDQPDCDRLSNGTVEVVVPTAFGPRVARYGFVGRENAFGEAPSGSVTDLGEWKPRGGHRLWHAPEGMPRSYSPDNARVERDISGDTVRLRQAVEPKVGIQKEMAVTLDPSGTHVTVHHILTNRTLWPVELAAWAMSIMNPGGTVILPQEPYVDQPHNLLPVRPLVLWSYTDLSDPRFAIGPKYIRVRVMADRNEPQKIGIGNKQGWAAYHRGRTLFVKRMPWDDAARYTDYGSNCETYVRGPFVELESLGPLQRLEPGASTEYVEHWYLFPDVEIGGTEATLDAALQPLLPKTGPR